MGAETMDPHSAHSPAAASPAVAVDPVCGMTVDPARTPHHADYRGETYHFCGAGCREKFVREPERYLQKQEPMAAHAHPMPAPAPPIPAGAPVEYTCPMHPEIVRDRPGSCPICGMALEPRTISAGGPEENPELAVMTRRFWISALLTLPLLLVAMGEMAGLRVPGLSPAGLNWLELLLATPVVLWGGWPFF